MSDEAQPFTRAEFDALVKEKTNRDPVVMFSLKWERLVATVRSGFADDEFPTPKVEGPNA